MGLVHVELFATLDLVGQSPGSPTEDPEDFPFGGWQAPLLDELAGAQVAAAYAGTDALLLGRRTYDIFAAYWPHQQGGPDDGIAALFNRVPKYVASRGNPRLGWRDSHLLGANLPARIAELRDRHREVHVIGSIDFARSLVAEGLFDVLNLWVYPIVVGRGKRLFDADGVPSTLALLEAPTASEKGAVLLRYGPAGGAPQTGDMAAD